MPIEYQATIENGLPVPIHPDLLAQQLKRHEGKMVMQRIITGKRSNEQNSYYWGVVVKSVLFGLIDAGYEPENLNKDVVHDFLKASFNKVTIENKDTGEYIEVPGSTTDLDTGEYAFEYIDRIIQWSSEFLGITIPPPDKKYKENG